MLEVLGLRGTSRVHHFAMFDSPLILTSNDLGQLSCTKLVSYVPRFCLHRCKRQIREQSRGEQQPGCEKIEPQGRVAERACCHGMSTFMPLRGN